MESADRKHGRASDINAKKNLKARIFDENKKQDICRHKSSEHS